MNNQLCYYNDVLTVLIPINQQQYYTYPIEEYDIDIPEIVMFSDPYIKPIQIAKLHFSEARRIIRSFVDDYELETAKAINDNTISNTRSEGLLLHAMYDREY